MSGIPSTCICPPSLLPRRLSAAPDGTLSSGSSACTDGWFPICDCARSSVWLPPPAAEERSCDAVISVPMPSVSRCWSTSAPPGVAMAACSARAMLLPPLRAAASSDATRLPLPGSSDAAACGACSGSDAGCGPCPVLLLCKCCDNRATRAACCCSCWCCMSSSCARSDDGIPLSALGSCPEPADDADTRD
eukprot:351140-Chlamydomonas_euryale.AAC.17